MTRKHFIALADAIKQTGEETTYEVHRALAERVADVCAQTNDLFNREKFLKACGF